MATYCLMGFTFLFRNMKKLGMVMVDIYNSVNAIAATKVHT